MIKILTIFNYSIVHEYYNTQRQLYNVTQYISDQKMDKVPKEGIVLTYWQIRGIAQPIRHLLCYLNIEFQENIVNKNGGNNQVEEQFFNSGLPTITFGDEKLFDVVSIMRYLSQRQKKTQLLGLTPQDQGRINEILFKNFKEKNKLLPLLISGAKEIYQKPQQKAQITIKTLNKLIEDSKFIQGCLIYSKKGKHWIMNYITIIDFIFYQVCFYICNLYGDNLHINQNYMAFQKFKQLFQSQPFYQQNKTMLQSKHIFYLLDQQTNEAIRKSWKGDIQKLFIQY